VSELEPEQHRVTSPAPIKKNDAAPATQYVYFGLNLYIADLWLRVSSSAEILEHVDASALAHTFHVLSGSVLDT
jgi:hypothetical protein